MEEISPIFLWTLMPALIACGAALVTATIMQARADAEVSRHREIIAEARAMLAAQHRAMGERLRAAEEAARRQALDEFMAELRVEERQFVRESESRRKSLVVQERVCFRNMPLTGWVTREYAGATGLITPSGPQSAVQARGANCGYLPPNIIRAAITNRKPA